MINTKRFLQAKVQESFGLLEGRSVQSERQYYLDNWQSLSVSPSWIPTVDKVIDRLFLANQKVYLDVEKETKVPWFFIAIVHQLEGGSDFTTHLHNGDPLSARTVHVPANRPAHGEPPFSWRDSAVDALTIEGLVGFTSWSLESLCFHLEGYNGFGYRGRGINSPYLYAQSNLWTKGKYTGDGVFDPNAGSSQIGAVVFLKRMTQRGLISIDGQSKEPVPNTAKPFMQYGNKGVWVETLQTDLNECGYGPIEVDGDFGPATEATVRAFQRDNQLEVDGVVGPLTWGVLDKNQKSQYPLPHVGLRTELLQIAMEWAAKGRSFEQGNSIDKLVLQPLRPALGLGGTDEFYNWCAAWVTAVLRASGFKVPDQFPGEWATVALVDAWRGYAKRIGAWKSSNVKPKNADIVIYDWDGDQASDHIGIVARPDGDGIVALEGNRQGKEAIVHRSVVDIQGYVDIEILYATLNVKRVVS